jgi:hypothetical protein
MFFIGGLVDEHGRIEIDLLQLQILKTVERTTFEIIFQGTGLYIPTASRNSLKPALLAGMQ